LQVEDSVVTFVNTNLPAGSVGLYDGFSVEIRIGGFMDDRALSNSSTATVNAQASAAPQTNRGVWVLTAYGISGLALFGVLVYYFSTFVTH